MVSKNQEIVIQDACILFDLVDLGLLEYFYQLNFDAYTTPAVLKEIKTQNHSDKIKEQINTGNLKIDNNTDLATIIKLSRNHSGLSFADCSVLEFALRKNSIILSSDGLLRKISNRNKVKVHGTLFIIKELYLKEIMSLTEAIEKLELYAKINRWAPQKEIKKMIEELLCKR